MNHYSKIFSKYLSDDAMEAVIADEALIQHMLTFEAALANAQAQLNMIPLKAALQIEAAIRQLSLKPTALAASTLQNGIPVIALLAHIKTKLPDGAKGHLHMGATSQDVMDTAQVLIIKNALEIIETKTSVLIKQLTKLSKQFAKTPCMAHTRGQQALPITFGSKVNAWLQPLQRQLHRLKQIKQDLLVVQLGGAVGNLAAYVKKGPLLNKLLAKKLQLQPAASWHTQRDGLAAFTNWLAMHTSIMGKMGADVMVMAQSEVNEVTENVTGGGKSSAMPHKNNPVLSEALVAIAKINAGLQQQMLLAMLHQNERDATAWILEWNALPQLLNYTATALTHAVSITTNIKINAAQMLANIEKFKKAIE
ncbi:MAG: hypothetical protein EAZ16_08055 [Sphingobacteriales bacterium]|jgi:3-carboxy-cis,cis-muconate cycloisomerase|nr:MAG: hypothetical protein EAZ16_08055 [Sphingobacteriales bacterium]